MALVFDIACHTHTHAQLLSVFNFLLCFLHQDLVFRQCAKKVYNPFVKCGRDKNGGSRGSTGTMVTMVPSSRCGEARYFNFKMLLQANLVCSDMG